jgi:zinc D-Ala-D-Ala dipeptidase
MKNTIRIILITCIIFSCKSAKPPIEKGDFKSSDLVELIKLDPSIKLDIKYATNANLTGKPVYNEARAFLQREAAMALIKAHEALRKEGYGLLVFDGYRPWSVTKIFWDNTSKENKRFVADPKVGSKHNRGCAIDLTLFDLKTGKEVKMPGEYDEMSERSYPNYKGGTVEEKRLRDLLRAKMEAEGFMVYEYEWWHFDYKDWKSYRIVNIPFSEIK